jgi:uncharacterized protein (DUF433 family)
MVRIAYTPRPESLALVDQREWPLYSLAELSYFLGVPKTTLHSWTRRRTDKRGRVSEALIVPAEPKEALFSFYNLIEAHILSVTTRVHKVRVSAIRRALSELEAQNLATGVHPLLSREFYTDGKDLFVMMIERTVNLSRGGQLALKPILDQYLERIERDENFRPKKLFPSRQDKVVAITPSVSSGRPIIDGTGIPVSSIWSRYKAGDSIEFIADDYDIAMTQVEGAISYIEHLKAA